MSYTKTVTITFGDQAENHAGMEKIGSLAVDGFNLQDLQTAKSNFEAAGCQKVELIKLNDYLPTGTLCDQEAYVLIARKGVDVILTGLGPNQTTNYDADSMLVEQDGLTVDKKAYMYGRVVNKHARYNLCFADYNQEPDYAQGKGRIIDFSKVPVLNTLRKRLVDFIGPKSKDLMGEGNYYYDVSKCGIGWHGDAERRKVVAVRLGATIPLHYQWFFKHNPVGNQVKLEINHGDLYIMSEKAVGFDWKKSSILTLRHAAGADKFLAIKAPAANINTSPQSQISKTQITIKQVSNPTIANNTNKKISIKKIVKKDN